MTIYGIYSIYDSVREEFAPVFSASNDKEAARQTYKFVLQNEFNDEFRLIRIAQYKHNIPLPENHMHQIPDIIDNKANRDITHMWYEYRDKFNNIKKED